MWRFEDCEKVCKLFPFQLEIYDFGEIVRTPIIRQSRQSLSLSSAMKMNNIRRDIFGCLSFKDGDRRVRAR